MLKQLATDHIDQALNYKNICKRIISFVRKSLNFSLLKPWQRKFARLFLMSLMLHWVKLKLNKGEAITGAEGVGVIIERIKWLNELTALLTLAQTKIDEKIFV